MDCTKCGGHEFDLNDKIFSNGTKHKERRCSDCGAFAGYHAQPAESFSMPYGKYKGLSFLEIQDKDQQYLKWLASSEHNRITEKAIEFINGLADKQKNLAEEIEYRKHWEAKH